MQSDYKEALKELAKECRSVEDIQEKLRDIFKETLQQVFEAEMDEHLGYTKHDNTGNSRNGYSQKTIKSRYGATEAKIPRDRNGEFEPEIIKKHETSVNGLEEQIIAM